MSPDGTYVCLTRKNSPTAVILKKNQDDTYTNLNIAQTDTFTACDISKDRAVFGGPINVKIFKKFNSGVF